MIEDQNNEQKPKIIEQKEVNEILLPPEPQKQQPQKFQPQQIKLDERLPQPLKWYLFSWLIFLGAVIIYIIIWVISINFKINSYYYNTSNAVSSYIKVLSNSNCQSIIGSEDSTELMQLSRPFLASIVSLITSWVMWKLPISLNMLYLIFDQDNRKLKYLSWGIALLVMLTIDSIFTLLLKKLYTDYMLKAIAVILTPIVAVVNNLNNKIKALISALSPLLCIAFLFFFYIYLLPFVCRLVFKNLNSNQPYLIIYVYPFIDLLIYSGLLFINSKVPENAKPCLSSIHFFLLGYFCGITLLTSILQVQFYCLCLYIFFRNYFFTYVKWKWQLIINNPPCLSGWIILYYLSFILNFLPLIGIGPLVISMGYRSFQFAESCFLVYNDPALYHYSTNTPPTGYNTKLQGFIYWPAALIIWVVSTFSQQYPKRKPTFFDFFYSIAGIYMFYLGISAGLELPILTISVFT